MSKVREIFPTGDDFVHHATEENGYGYFLFSRDYWEKWRELGNEILQKPEFTIAKVDTNWWNQEECETSETKGKNQTKYPIRYYKLPDLGYVFYEDPNTGA